MSNCSICHFLETDNANNNLTTDRVGVWDAVSSEVYFSVSLHPTTTKRALYIPLSLTVNTQMMILVVYSQNTRNSHSISKQVLERLNGREPNPEGNSTQFSWLNGSKFNPEGGSTKFSCLNGRELVPEGGSNQFRCQNRRLDRRTFERIFFFFFLRMGLPI